MTAWGRKIGKSLLSWGVVLALIAAIPFYVSRDLVTGPPPEISGPLTSGERFMGLATLGKPAVIYFWASWCGVCKLMQPTLRSLAGDFPMITVALQSGDITAVKAYMKKNALDAPTVVDEEGAIAAEYGVRGVPAVFMVDGDGAIRYAMTGYATELGLRIRLWLASR
jgi:thiol-disulfide isomerase/thioredoxin